MIKLHTTRRWSSSDSCFDLAVFPSASAALFMYIAAGFHSLPYHFQSLDHFQLLVVTLGVSLPLGLIPRQTIPSFA